MGTFLFRNIDRECVSSPSLFRSGEIESERKTSISAKDMNHLDIIKTLYQTFENGEIDTILDILDPNVEGYELDKFPDGSM